MREELLLSPSAHPSPRRARWEAALRPVLRQLRKDARDCRLLLHKNWLLKKRTALSTALEILLPLSLVLVFSYFNGQSANSSFPRTSFLGTASAPLCTCSGTAGPVNLGLAAQGCAVCKPGDLAVREGCPANCSAFGSCACDGGCTAASSGHCVAGAGILGSTEGALASQAPLLDHVLPGSVFLQMLAGSGAGYNQWAGDLPGFGGRKVGLAPRAAGKRFQSSMDELYPFLKVQGRLVSGADTSFMVPAFSSVATLYDDEAALVGYVAGDEYGKRGLLHTGLVLGEPGTGGRARHQWAYSIRQNGTLIFATTPSTAGSPVTPFHRGMTYAPLARSRLTSAFSYTSTYSRLTPLLVSTLAPLLVVANQTTRYDPLQMYSQEGFMTVQTMVDRYIINTTKGNGRVDERFTAEELLLAAGFNPLFVGALSAAAADDRAGGAGVGVTCQCGPPGSTPTPGSGTCDRGTGARTSCAAALEQLARPYRLAPALLRVAPFPSRPYVVPATRYSLLATYD